MDNSMETASFPGNEQQQQQIQQQVQQVQQQLQQQLQQLQQQQLQQQQLQQQLQQQQQQIQQQQQQTTQMHMVKMAMVQADMDVLMDDSLDSGGAMGTSQTSSSSATEIPVIITAMPHVTSNVQQIQIAPQPTNSSVVGAPQGTVVATVASSPVAQVTVAPAPIAQATMIAQPPVATVAPATPTPSRTPTPASTPTPAPTSTPSSSKKKSTKNKVVTGYILYSREVRKQVVQNNPESTFGDISRIVGAEWKALPQTEKQMWEERASRMNEETKQSMLAANAAAAAAAGDDITVMGQCASPVPLVQQPPPDQVFECLWDKCDFQFEEVSDLIEHCIKDKEASPGHVHAYFAENPTTEFHCHWRNCARNRKGNPTPFPNITRLIRHIRDMHINKGNGRSVAPENRSKNFKPSSKPQAVNRPTPSATPNPPGGTFAAGGSSGGAASSTANAQKVGAASGATAGAAAAACASPPEPLFITVPPRPQRVFHSEAYIRYIEGLQADSKHITPWEKTLHATQENTPAPDPEKLKNVATWLGKKATDQHDNVVAALWNLRNQLLKDTLSLHKTL